MRRAALAIIAHERKCYAALRWRQPHLRTNRAASRQPWTYNLCMQATAGHGKRKCSQSFSMQ